MHTKVPMCTSRKSDVWSRCNSCRSKLGGCYADRGWVCPRHFPPSLISIMKAITSNIRLMYLSIPTACLLGVPCTRMKAYYANVTIGKPACT